jgi:alpha-amylase
VELLGGAYYEPILPAISEADRLGQIRKLSDALRRRFGRAPTGLWLAERVWEPDLPGSLHLAGVGYTLLDDTHFLSAGADPEELDGAYLTEDRGHVIAVFPISKKLRYLVPFRPPEETLEFLRGEAERGPGRVFLLGDDGEKFGHWPETQALVYGEGWLERFFTLLEENGEWLRTGFPSEHVHPGAIRGRIYLPTAAYEEMGEWTLPARLQARYRAFHDRVRDSDAENARFLRGGTWRAFFARYPESDHMSQRGLRLGEEADALAEAHPEIHGPIRDSLWAAQCNCAYWHGVFGGIYLPHLRDAVWRKLLEAEAMLCETRHPEAAWAEGTRVDLDADGESEVLLRNDRLTAVVDPGRGGALVELSLRRPPLALGNGLSRRYEAYHDRLPAAPQDSASGAASAGTATSIHDRLLAKEPGLDRFLHYDGYPRLSLLDHVMEADTERAVWEEGRLPDVWGLGAPYRAAMAEAAKAVTLVLRRTSGRGGSEEIVVEKTLTLAAGGARLEVAYRLEGVAPLDRKTRFGVEWNFAMLDATSPQRRMILKGEEGGRSLSSRGESHPAEGVILVDRERGFRVELGWNRPARLWWAPVETVSLSESGLERVYQSTALLPTWSLTLRPGFAFTVSFVLEVTVLA